MLSRKCIRKLTLYTILLLYFQQDRKFICLKNYVQVWLGGRKRYNIYKYCTFVVNNIVPEARFKHTHNIVAKKNRAINAISSVLSQKCPLIDGALVCSDYDTCAQMGDRNMCTFTILRQFVYVSHELPTNVASLLVTPCACAKG